MTCSQILFARQTKAQRLSLSTLMHGKVILQCHMPQSMPHATPGMSTKDLPVPPGSQAISHSCSKVGMHAPGLSLIAFNVSAPRCSSCRIDQSLTCRKPEVAIMHCTTSVARQDETLQIRWPLAIGLVPIPEEPL